MIQRIQSVYLLLVSCLCLLTAFSPLLDFYSDTFFETFDAWGIYANGEMRFSTFALAILLFIVTALSFAEIFLYKKRILQMRISGFSILLLIGFYLAFLFFVYTQKKLGVEIHLKFYVGLPFVCIILEYLAIRAIGKDEALIRSLNRLR